MDLQDNVSEMSEAHPYSASLLAQFRHAWALPAPMAAMMDGYRVHPRDLEDDNNIDELFVGAVPARDDGSASEDPGAESVSEDWTVSERAERKSTAYMRAAYAQALLPTAHTWRSFYLALYDYHRPPNMAHLTPGDLTPAWETLAADILSAYRASALACIALLGWNVVEERATHDERGSFEISRPFVKALCYRSIWQRSVLFFECCAKNVFLHVEVSLMTHPGECVPCIFSAAIESVGLGGDRISVQGKRRAFRGEDGAPIHVQADLLCQNRDEDDLAQLLSMIDRCNAVICRAELDALLVDAPIEECNHPDCTHLQINK